MSAPSVSSTEKAKVAAAEAKAAAAAARQAAKEAAAAAKEERRKEREAKKAAKAAAKAALPKKPRGRPRKNPVVVAEAAASDSGGTTDMDNMSAASSTHFDADSDSEVAVLRAELSALKARHAALEIAYHKAAHTLDSIRATLAIAAL